ncbi:hypothetical protein KSC_058240 [Ktedonobacter sp. SOSP1-52]|nr:hypothetical protein KSC_058240 [Ktedonobacter sp. SOSP1-52]
MTTKKYVQAIVGQLRLIDLGEASILLLGKGEKTDDDNVRIARNRSSTFLHIENYCCSQTPPGIPAYFTSA